MEAGVDEEEFLALRLAVVTDSGCEKRKKRKRKEGLNPSGPNEQEGKIFRLLQLREQMLRHDQKIEDGKGVHLIQLLLLSAKSVNDKNFNLAVKNLCELYQDVWLTGDSVQRVAAYFADALVARLITCKSPFYDMIMKGPTQEEEFLAFTELYRVSPFYQFGHFTANQAILEAFHKDKQENPHNRALHVIDFDISYGFQWPCLMQSLSESATTSNHKISLKITGFGKSLEELQETESRLVSFAKGFGNLVFDFHGLVNSSKQLVKLKKKKNETLAVNSVFHLNSSTDIFINTSETLRIIRSLDPSIVVLVEQEATRSPQNFLSGFMESLHYFAAIFDSLDDCLPLNSPERRDIERNHLGREIKNLINSDHEMENCQKYGKTETARTRMENHGFVGLKWSSMSRMQAKLLLKIRSHFCPVINGDGENGFRVFERDEGKILSLGWQERLLITASAWGSSV